MELLLAVLVSFGVITSNQTSNISKAEAEKLVKENGITQKQIEDQASIIGLEESDM